MDSYYIYEILNDLRDIQNMQDHCNEKLLTQIKSQLKPIDDCLRETLWNKIYNEVNEKLNENN
jgi:hypothetical protein